MPNFTDLTPPEKGGKISSWDMTAADFKKTGFVMGTVYREAAIPTGLTPTVAWALPPIPAGHAPFDEYDDSRNFYPGPDERWAIAQSPDPTWDNPYPSRDPYAIG